MEPDIFRFIYKYSKREQIVLLAITAISYPFFYFSLNIPKDIVNHLNAVVKHIGDGHGRTPADYPVQALFDLVSLNAYSYLFALCGLFLGLVLINGAFKYIINVVSGRTGERLLRRLRYQLYTRMLRFPLPQFRKTSQGELIAMITAEVDAQSQVRQVRQRRLGLHRARRAQRIDETGAILRHHLVEHLQHLVGLRAVRGCEPLSFGAGEQRRGARVEAVHLELRGLRQLPDHPRDDVGGAAPLRCEPALRLGRVSQADHLDEVGQVEGPRDAQCAGAKPRDRTSR